MKTAVVQTRRVVVLVIGISTVVAVVLFCLWLTRGRIPETEEISRAISPGGVWVAKLDMVVYGDHHFVNDARYEVRIRQVSNQENEVLVYSVQASGPLGTAITWGSNEELIIEDTLTALAGASKQPHHTVKIEYRPM